MATEPHDHAHDHQPPPDEDGPLGYYQTMEIAVRELLIEKGVFGADDVRAAIEAMDARSPAKGAEVVARAWTDPAFKDVLLADGTEACASLGIDLGPTRLIAVENTATVHNVIVCHPLFLLSAQPPGPPAGLVQGEGLPLAGGVRAPRRVARVRHRDARRRDRAGARFDRRHALHCRAAPPRRHRGLGARAPCGPRHPRLHDRRDGAEDPLRRPCGAREGVGRP